MFKEYKPMTHEEFHKALHDLEEVEEE